VAGVDVLPHTDAGHVQAGGGDRTRRNKRSAAG
jgi:hypothetical protein